MPFCVCGAVNCGEGELTRLVLVWGGHGEALSDVAGDGGDVGDVAVFEGESSAGGNLVGCRVVVADLDWDRGVGVFLVGIHIGCAQSGDCGVGLISYRGHGPALPVEGAVLEIWDLRGQRWVNV